MKTKMKIVAAWMRANNADEVLYSYDSSEYGDYSCFEYGMISITFIGDCGLQNEQNYTLEQIEEQIEGEK